MMRKYGWFIGPLVAALALLGCGGNDPSSFASTSSSSSSGGGSSVAASITLISSVPQLPSNNSTPATLTAIVKNAQNAVVTGADVVFATSSGVIAPAVTSSGVTAGTTDNNGEAAATLTTPGDPSNRTLTVTATVGTVSATIKLDVVGTQLSLTGPASLIQGSIGTFSASLTNSGGVGIPNTAVAVTSAKGNTLSAANLTTDATGHVTFTMTATNAGADTVTATALGVSASQAVAVSSQNFAFTSPAANTTVVLNAAQTVTLVWTNAGAAVTGQAVSFSTTRGLFSGGTTTVTVNTDGTGTATASISSTSAGPAVITASASGVSAQLTLGFVATTPSQIDVQASPATIPTSGSSTITAIVRDAQNNLVANQTIDFQLSDKTGGSLSVGSALTNAQGVASTVYTATTSASAASGVTVTATVQGTAIQNSVSLTVGGQTVFLSLGTGNLITPLNSTQFTMPWTLQAVDSGGNPVTGVTVTFTVHSFPYADIPPAQINANGSTAAGYAAYAKGSWLPIADVAQCNGVIGTVWCQFVTTTCFNEDVTGSGVLQSPSEDINGNGRLDPGDVASVSPGSGVTDSTGTVPISILYPQDHAEWVHVKLTASATVSGTESSTSANFWLPILASDVDTANTTPPGYNSPYGVAAVCTNPN
ncbi:MAG: Ig-like domain-containing protein [Steroidobacterales bacterium]